MIDRPDPAWLAGLAVGAAVAYPMPLPYRASEIIPATVERLTKARIFIMPLKHNARVAVNRVTGQVIGAYGDFILPWTKGLEQEYGERVARRRLASRCERLARTDVKDMPIAHVRTLLAVIDGLVNGTPPDAAAPKRVKVPTTRGCMECGESSEKDWIAAIRAAGYEVEP